MRKAAVVRMDAETIVVQCAYGQHCHAHRLGEVRDRDGLLVLTAKYGKRCYYVGDPRGVF